MNKLLLVLLVTSLFACDSNQGVETSQPKKSGAMMEKAGQDSMEKPAADKLNDNNKAMKNDAPMVDKAKMMPSEAQPMAMAAMKEKTAEATVPTKVLEPLSGEQVYQKSCQTCHAVGVSGAPKAGDSAAWKIRLDKGIDVLYASASKGMPGTIMIAKGTCAACSDDELKAAVDYMLSTSGLSK